MEVLVLGLPQTQRPSEKYFKIWAVIIYFSPFVVKAGPGSKPIKVQYVLYTLLH